MRLLASVPVRLFLICWIVFTVHFATNVVREHYPAFTIIDAFTFKVDPYWGFHPDIFEHEGHYVVGNNVMASVIAAVPLLIFDPVLDAIEAYEKRQLAKYGPPKTEYRTHHENSVKLLRVVKEKGLSLRFGAATVVTSAFLMAPVSALLVVLMFFILRERGRSERESIWLSFVFAFSTPYFFRTAVLNHNMMLAWVTFLAFWLIWVRPGNEAPLSVGRRAWAGALCGLGLALDYSGVIPLLVFFAYLIVRRVPSGGWKKAILESIPFVLGSVPPVLYLLYTQWAMYGHPIYPGQYWMPDTHGTPYHDVYTNPYSDKGFRGFTLPTPDLYLLNLFDPTYGMYTYGPLLMLGLVPMWRLAKDRMLILDKPEWWFVTAYFFAFLTFCSANQYSRIQFNSGFRYLIPLVPLVFLQVADVLVRLPRAWLLAILIPCTLNSWVISMVREPVPASWAHIFEHGLQFPWLFVLRATQPEDHPVLGSIFLAPALMMLVAGVCLAIWHGGARARRRIVA